MLIECSNIKKSFQGIDLLKDISFKVDDHDKIAIIGVNGAGKTTILNILIRHLNARYFRNFTLVFFQYF